MGQDASTDRHLNARRAPLVLHVVHRLALGGLENGLVNLINHMPEQRYRHAIMCLTDSTDFRRRLRRQDVPVIALAKREGQDFSVYTRLWRALRQLRPDIVHTRNLGTLDCLAVAALAGVRGRIHGEHGRDMYDLHGSRLKYKLLRKFVAPAVDRYVAVSKDLAGWLVQSVGISPERVTQIYNGVDTRRFHPRVGRRHALMPANFAPEGAFVVGTVGRMESVKDQLTLVNAFVQLAASGRCQHEQVRLVIVGDGPLRQTALELLRSAKMDHLAWLPGERSDIPEVMQTLDLFVLPSLGEGTSNTILEAMATGLPVVATRVGGNLELVTEGETGLLVPPGDPDRMARAIESYVIARDNTSRHGRVARRRTEEQFAIEAMVSRYLDVYDTVLNRRGNRKRQRGQLICGGPRVLKFEVGRRLDPRWRTG